MKTLRMYMLLLPVLLLAAPLTTIAQPDEPFGPGRKRIEELRKMKLIEALDLNEDQTTKIFVREKEFRKKEHALVEKRKQILGRLGELTKSNGADAEKLKEIASLRDLGNEMVQQRYDYMMSLKDVLSTQQLAKMVLFEDRFMTELRNVLRKTRGGQKDDK
jgi:hypothetical protein